MEVAGLVVGVVGLAGLWSACIQAFDVVATGRSYGMDYEITRIKLEVERVRLIIWGETVGLTSVQSSKTADPRSLSVDARLDNIPIQRIIIHLLACMQMMFENSDELQKKYGLQQVGGNTTGQTGLETAGRSFTMVADGNQNVMGSIFKRAYTSLHKSAKEYQQNTSLIRKAKWAISDREKFRNFVAEIRSFNDSLFSLLPDVRTTASTRIREEIEASDEVRSLQILQQAAEEDNEEISDSASVRLVNLGATMASGMWQDPEPPDEQAPSPTPKLNLASARPNAGQSDPDVDELEKKLEATKLYVEEKGKGQIICRIYSSSLSARYSASVRWNGHDDDFTSREYNSYKGIARNSDGVFNIYRRKKFLKKAREDPYNTHTSEDYVLLDVESHTAYENINPGTVTVEGFGLECWDYRELFGGPWEQTVLVSYAELPELPAKKLLRRIDELKNLERIGRDKQRNYDDLKKFTGSMGTTWFDPNEALKTEHQIGDLYRLLNRRDIFADFNQSSSVALFLVTQDEKSIGIWNFLYQVILTKELARRLQAFPDVAIAGFTGKVLASLIVSDLWLQNASVILVDDAGPQKQKPDGEDKSEDKPGGEDKPDGEEKPDGKDRGKAETEPQGDPYDTEGRKVEIHSHVHEQQVESLLRFGEIMKWSSINETRDFAEDVYGKLRSGTTVKLDVWDWIFGTVLPGKWAGFKIMAALVLCTPSLAEELGVSNYFDSGLSMPKQSYWRTRTVLGRVLGCLPGVKSLCGWIGPCPAVQGPHHKYIRLKSRRVSPPMCDIDTSRIGGMGPDEGEDTIRLKLDENVNRYIEEIKDESRWAIPEPPVRQMMVTILNSIRIKALTLESHVVAKKSTMSERELEEETEYRASMVFTTDNGSPVTYTLYTNPVFVTPPTCLNGPHRVHSRELRKFHQNTWNIEDLKDTTVDQYENGGVLLINATGYGAEVMARAWCSENGKNAIIRRTPGPCFACAYNAASTKGLGVGVLIWVS